MENLKIDLFQDEIFVFTPKGDLYQLPKGATPIDFAFAVHTDIGLHCLTAKINGQIVPLGTALKSGDAVRIVTSSHQKPNQSWLEVVKTSKARQCIRRWLKEEQYAHSVRLGQEMLEREAKRYRSAPQSKDLDAVADELGYADGERLCAAIGSGDLSVVRVVNRLIPNRPRPQKRPALQDKRGIRIQGMNDMMINFAKCCTPIPGDSVIGLITRGRGVSVHRADCPNISASADEPERLLSVEWDLQEEHVFTVQLLVRSHDRKYLLSDISKVISDTGIDIRGASTRTVDHMAEQSFLIDVKNIQQLQTTIERLRKVRGVTEIERVDEPQILPALLPGENPEE